METIKYEPVFGDQSLFDVAPKDVVAVYVNTYPKLNYNLLNQVGVENHSHRELIALPIVAMRRIIKTPVWTVADKKAGRLPEVGALIVNVESGDQFSFVGINAGSKRWACMDVHDGFLYFFKPNEMSPIETAEERAQRLREEWKNNVIEIHHGKRRKMSTSTFLLDDIYDALLSGELQSPKDSK